MSLRAAAGTASTQLLVAALAEHRDARLGDRGLVAAEPGRGAQAGFGVVLLVEAAVHARLVVGAGQELAELLLNLQFDLLRERVVAPGLAHQRLGALAVALREQRAGERQLALGAERLVAAEVGADRGRVDAGPGTAMASALRRSVAMLGQVGLAR